MNTTQRRQPVRRWLPLALILLWPLTSGSALGQEQAPKPGVVRLQSRELVLSVETTGAFMRALAVTRLPAQHGIVQLREPPGAAAQARLDSAGITVLDAVAGTFYYGRVAAGTQLADQRVVGLLVALSVLQAQDKVTPAIWNGQFEKYVVSPPDTTPYNYVLNEDGTLNLTVQFFSKVPENQITEFLAANARSLQKLSDVNWTVVISPEALRSMAASDIVKWIDAAPIPFLPENDNTRAATGVNAVQNFNTATGQVLGLGGRNVQAGVFDSGVDEAHEDFATHDAVGNITGTRVTQNDGGVGTHGTHVAGILAGSGWRSNRNDNGGNPNGGTTFQWRGMAPLAQLIDASNASGGNAAQLLSYTTVNGMDVSNHSYSLSFDGGYDLANQFRDQTIQG
ncbi:MAG: S8 family serine peptidase, partial [Gemmatimonadales bacterium]